MSVVKKAENIFLTHTFIVLWVLYGIFLMTPLGQNFSPFRLSEYVTDYLLGYNDSY